MPIKIILADDHSLYLQGLMLLLKENQNFEILGNANSGKDAVELAKQNHKKADIFLLDLHLPDMNAIEIVTEIRKFSQDLKIIMLTHKKEIAIYQNLLN